MSRDDVRTDPSDPSSADDPAELAFDLGRIAAHELRVKLVRHPYPVLGAAAALGFLLARSGAAGWIASGVLLVLRATARRAAREALRRAVVAASPAALGVRRARRTSVH